MKSRSWSRWSKLSDKRLGETLIVIDNEALTTAVPTCVFVYHHHYTMASATDTSWYPTLGRHAVSVGPSLGRALKARKGVAPPAKAKRANLPDREFYSFRCEWNSNLPDLLNGIHSYGRVDNFQPDSIDSSRPGTIDMKRGSGSTSITVERPSTQVWTSSIMLCLGD